MCALQPLALAAFVCALAGSAGRPALAEETGALLCGEERALSRSDMAEVLRGLYEIELEAGYVVTAGIALPHPASDEPAFAHIVERDGQLLVVPIDPGGVTLELEWAGDETWRFDHDPSLPEGTRTAPGQSLPTLTLDSEELGAMLGCSINDLPRFIGRADVAIEGVVMHFTYRLMLVDADQLFGIQEVRSMVRGMPVVERRPVRFIQHTDPAENDPPENE